ncbi:MAG: tryptophan 7-halogenase [Acidobacteriota bacterium]|nr:tryptophan 7-halogenase [Acidobacteriota bacterium]
MADAPAVVTPGTERRCDVAIVGSGFAASILSRTLVRQGLQVVMLERASHPRFALGESSTPLAALSLERLARRWRLPDLYALAAYGRWRSTLPHLRRGLKRGFTFYSHSPGVPYANSPDNDHRLLVAASPNTSVADAHWLRADVDAHLALAAARDGVELWEETTLDGIEPTAAGLRLQGESHRRRFALTARQVVDGSGRAGFLASQGVVQEVPPDRHHSLVYSHFRGLKPFPPLAQQAGASCQPGPYPDEAAALHHLLDEGWMYVLPFDHGVASCGLVLREPAEGERPEEIWQRVLARYPTLAASFVTAETVRPLERVVQLPYRRSAAAGDRWVLLPHSLAFSDPLFSTGMAWSLLAVERLADLLPKMLAGEGDGREYGRLLHREADHIEALVRAAYAALPDFEAFTAVTFLYFAAASFAESRQRLVPDLPRPAWEVFLGAEDPVLSGLPERAWERLGSGPGDESFRSWLLDAIAPRDVAGLGDPQRLNLYPLDLEILVQRAELLGLTPDAVRAALPRLRGQRS